MKKTTLVYITTPTHILLMHRNKNKMDINYNKYIGVGGKLKPLESPVQCMIREVYEETALKVLKHHYHGTVLFKSDKDTEKMYLYSVTEFKGTLKGNNEGTLKWVNKKCINTLPMWAGDTLFFDLMNTEKRPFKLVLYYQGEALIKAVLDNKVLKV